jgi:hypothetical protein
MSNSDATDTDINVNQLWLSNNKAPHENETVDMSEDNTLSIDPHGGGDRALNLPPAPDGGWGWMIVFGSFMVTVVINGVFSSTGILAEEFVEYFGCSYAEKETLGSLMTAFCWGTGEYYCHCIHLKFSSKYKLCNPL